MSEMSFFLLFATAAVLVGITLYNLIVGQGMQRYTERLERDVKTGIMKGAEPLLLKNSGSKAVLLIHGFIGSPTDFGRLPKLLHDAGYTVSVPLLPGHGTDPRDFSKTTASELEAFVRTEYHKLKQAYDEVVLIGFSMGGALSVLTAAQEDVDRLVLIAPYFKIKHQWYYGLPTEIYQRLLVNVIPYTYRPLAFKQIKNRAAIPFMLDYDYVSLKGSDAAIRLGDKASKSALSMKQPTLILHSTGDMATDYLATKRIAEQLAGHCDCRFVTLKNTNHIVMWDYDSEAAEQEILVFLSKSTA